MDAQGQAARVSVVIPAYNCSATIGRTLDSVRAQSFQPLEVVVVDDGSEDATAARVEQAAVEQASAGLPALRLLRAERGGPYRSRNLGIAETSGEYVAFLDADDLWAPDKIARQVAVLDGDPEAGLCHTAVVHIDAADRALRLRHPCEAYRGACFHRLLVRNGITTSAVLVRRALLERLGGFDDAFTARGDWEMWTRLARVARVACVPEPLTFYREHPGNMTAATARMRRYHQAIITKNERLYGATDSRIRRCLEEARVEMHRDFGIRYFLEDKRELARAELGEALRLRPGWPSLYLQYLKASLPSALMSLLRASRRRLPGPSSRAAKTATPAVPVARPKE